MKKGLTLFFATTLALSVSVTPVVAKPSNGKSITSSTQKETTQKETVQTEDSKKETQKETAQKETKQKETENGADVSADDSTTKSDKLESQKTNSQDNKKVFKDELNEKKKELQQEKSSLNQQLEELKLQYENMLASGNEAGAASILENINEMNKQIEGVREQIKETINERYMVAKTMYTDEELAEFTNASDLISQMYADAEVLSAGSVTINNNLIKFDAPAYIKNGVTLVPLRAISEELGGEVSWDGETQTVTITNGDIVVQITANGTTGMVNGEAVEIGVPATKNAGRTYVPLRFLAEALGFDTEWDSENELIDISDGTETSEDDGTETSVEEVLVNDGTETSAEEVPVNDGTETSAEEVPVNDGTETSGEEAPVNDGTETSAE